MKNIQIIIIEDNKLLRKGIQFMLKEHKDIQVIAALGDRLNIQDKIREFKPHVLLLDLGLIHQNSLKLVKSLHKQLPKLKIIVMDLLPAQSDMKQFIEAGVSGFIIKDATSQKFIDTIRSVAKGDKVFPAQLNGTVFSEIFDNSLYELMHSKLMESIRMTENEKKISDFVSKGLNNKEIAEKLSLNASMVKGHIDNILEKLSLSKYVQIAVYRNSGGDSINSSYVQLMKAKILKKERTNGFYQKRTNFL